MPLGTVETAIREARETIVVLHEIARRNEARLKVLEQKYGIDEYPLIALSYCICGKNTCICGLRRKP